MTVFPIVAGARAERISDTRSIIWYNAPLALQRPVEPIPNAHKSGRNTSIPTPFLDVKTPTKVLKCIHFNGNITNQTCRTGIPYASVRLNEGTTYRLPCIVSEGCSERCEQYEQEERDEE